MLAARILTALVFGAAITAAILFAPSPVTAAVLALLWLAGVWEWAAFAQLPPAGRVGYTLLFAVAMAVGWWLDGQGLLVLLAAALAWWLFALALVVRYPRSFSSTFVALAGIVVLLPSWALLVRLARRRRARRRARVHAARHRLGGRRRRLRVRPAARPDQARPRREPGQDVGRRHGRPRDGGARRRDRGALAGAAPWPPRRP